MNGSDDLTERFGWHAVDICASLLMMMISKLSESILRLLTRLCELTLHHDVILSPGLSSRVLGRAGEFSCMFRLNSVDSE